VGAIGLAAAAAATTSVFACQQLVGIPDNPPASTAVNACGLPYGTNACASCVATSCCNESSACAASPVCAAYETCLGKSNGDWQTRTQCAIDHPVGGSSEVSPLSACLATHCVNECGLTCGGLAANYTVPDHAAMCQQCVTGSSFCAPERACASSEACDALVRCRLACETSDCIDGCLSTYDAGANLFASLIGVFHGACSAPCAFGKDWTCVGRVSWPNRKAATTAFTVDVQDYSTGAPLSGVDLSVCDGNDLACNPPHLADGQTDSTGRAVMQVPNQEQGDGFGLNGYLQFTSPNAVSTLLYWGFPLSESAFTLTDNAFFFTAARLIRPADLQQQATSLKIVLDPNLGVLFVWVTDCHNRPAPGVQVTPTNVSGLRAVYGQDSTAMATGPNGQLTFFNVQPGTVDLTAVPLVPGKASSHVSVLVRPGFVTVVGMLPTP
jgi:hypothetical protein